MKNKKLEVYYVPFEHINENARVTLIGITPGWTQMEIAYRKARIYMGEGKSFMEACRLLETEASFAGTMRTNLVSMLDGISLHQALGISTCDQLFHEHMDLAHTTSAIKYPVFIKKETDTINWENYSGNQPDIEREPILRKYVEESLASELKSVDKALIVPLGWSVYRALRILIDGGSVEPERCLIGFPHPSGANASRVTKYGENKAAMEKIVREWFSRG